jgi:hypothetical protein
MDSLSVRNAVASLGDARFGGDEIAGALKLRFGVEDGQMCFAMDLADLKVSGLRLDRVAEPGEPQGGPR